MRERFDFKYILLQQSNATQKKKERTLGTMVRSF